MKGDVVGHYENLDYGSKVTGGYDCLYKACGASLGKSSSQIRNDIVSSMERNPGSFAPMIFAPNYLASTQLGTIGLMQGGYVDVPESFYVKAFINPDEVDPSSAEFLKYLAQVSEKGLRLASSMNPYVLGMLRVTLKTGSGALVGASGGPVGIAYGALSGFGVGVSQEIAGHALSKPMGEAIEFGINKASDGFVALNGDSDLTKEQISNIMRFGLLLSGSKSEAKSVILKKDYMERL
jgi:hypothetical protein